MDRKRSRGGGGGVDDPDGDDVNPLLREAQFKAVSVELGRYRSQLAALGARESEAQAAKNALSDIVSHLARQFAAVSCV